MSWGAPRLATFCVVGMAGLALLAIALQACGETPSTQPGAAAVSASPRDAANSWNLPGQPPYLVAHYLPWFEVTNPATGEQTWRHWRWDGAGEKHDPRQRTADGRRDIASVFYPLIGPYSSGDREVVRYHLRTAKAVGVSVMLVLWYGPGSADADTHLPMLLDEALAADMRIAICYEEKINWPPYRQPTSREQVVKSVTDDLTFLVTKYGKHDAYLKRDGKPFVAQFNFWGDDELGPRNLLADEWAQVFAALPEQVYYCRQNLDRLEMHPTIRSAFMWIKADPAWLKDFAYFAGRAEQLYREGDLDFFMSFISPGFDDTGVWGWGGGPRVLPRDGLNVLDQTMAMATAGNAELVQIVTWNDWEEGTSVEPSRETGYLYLDAIEQWWGRVTGRPVNLADNRQPLLELAQRASEAQRAEMPADLSRYLLTEE